MLYKAVPSAKTANCMFLIRNVVNGPVCRLTSIPDKDLYVRNSINYLNYYITNVGRIGPYERSQQAPLSPIDRILPYVLCSMCSISVVTLPTIDNTLRLNT